MKKSLIVVSIAALLLGACAPKEKTITVSEFMPDTALTKKTRIWCMENPAEREPLPNCINSNAAMLRVMQTCHFKDNDPADCPKQPPTKD